MSDILNYEEEFNSSQVPVDTITRQEVRDMIDDIPKPLFQRSLQPGATPLDEDNRFLCWNSFGIIRACYGIKNQCIDVLYHDTEKHSSLNFDNEINYSFGSMNDDAIVLGSNGKHDSGPPNLHGVNLLEATREEREWDIELPPYERIEALAVGRGFVAVATDMRNLRFFTHGGLQSFLLTTPGQIVSLVAHEKQLMMVYHDGAGQPNEQTLSMQVNYIDLLNNEFKPMFNRVGLALGPRTQLSWVGFTDEGTPCTYDFHGTIRMFRAELANSWVPILNLKELTSSALDHYFLVGVSELSQSVRAVKCKRSRYPEFTDEIADVIGFSIPLCDVMTEKGKLEEEYVRLQIANLSYRRLANFKRLSSLAKSRLEANDKMLVNNVLRLFSTYLRQNRQETAINLVYMIPYEYMTMLPEFAHRAKKSQHIIDALNRVIEERKQIEEEMESQPDSGMELI